MKPILISLSPNTDKKDAFRAFKILIKPWTWINGDSRNIFEEKLREYFNVYDAYGIVSARWGIYLILKSLNLPEDSEVLIQAFTCVSVPGPVLWAGLKPVYVDILENELTMDPDDLARKITDKSKVLIIQHTFGCPARLQELISVAKKHDLIVIEDSAHTIGAKYGNKLLGTFGDASVLSFGRDKAISGVFGGAILVSNPERLINLKIEYEKLKNAGKIFVFQQLLHPILFELIVKPFYFFFSIGKIKLVCLQNLKILSKALSRRERNGGEPNFPISKLPNALASLAFSQFKEIEKFNKKRKEIATIYSQNLKDTDLGLPKCPEGSEPAFLRYSIQTPKASIIKKEAKKEKILLGDWYEVIAPKDTDLKAINYVKGSCPKAEEAALKIINLPTYPKMEIKDAERIVKFIKEKIND